MTCPLCNDTGYKDHASMLCLDTCGHGEGVDLVERLRSYRPRDEWGDGVHHMICTEAAAEIKRLREALEVCRDVLFSRIPRLGPEGPNTVEEQREYEEIGGAWSMADRALKEQTNG